MENNGISLERSLAKYKSIIKCEGIIMILIYSIPALFMLVAAGFGGLTGFTVFFFFLPLLGYAGIKVSKEGNISTAQTYKAVLFGVVACSAGIIACCSIGFLIFYILYANFECTKEMYDTCGTHVALYVIPMAFFGFFGICSVIICPLFSIFFCHAKKFHELLLAKERASLPPVAHQLPQFQYVPQYQNPAQTFIAQPISPYQYIPLQEIPQRVV